VRAAVHPDRLPADTDLDDYQFSGSAGGALHH
jgi:hypothetical protein